MKSPERFFLQPKVTTTHLELLAYIYIRQSSPGQVKHNVESQTYQRRMAERAESLGWHKEQIRVIDSDQATTARYSDHRDGYKEMVAEISLGRVGIIFGYEVGRVSRNNSDWYALLDVAAMFGTLIADADGVYDPRHYNDRMLLGLKGAISEAELHLIRSRLKEGRMQQVERGEFEQRLPSGLVRLSDGSVVKDPNEQVCSAIDLVFAKFQELGSCGQVLRYFRQHTILLPRYQFSGVQNGRMVWKPATRTAVYDIISNPAYAGAFAYSRRQVDDRRQSIRPSRGGLRRNPKDWINVVQDVYPAFISWTQFKANLARLRQLSSQYFTSSKAGISGPAREGQALLQGIALCGRCGCRLMINYNSEGWYFCNHHHDTGLAKCPSVPRKFVDRAVEEAFFEALEPSQLDALEALLAKRERESAQIERHKQQELKRLLYEAELADQRFHNVDPRNRLVAAELERRWETKRQELQQAEEELESFLQRPTSVSPEFRQYFKHISTTLPALWSGATISHKHKKAILRSLISNVIIYRNVREIVEIKVIWVSGHCSVTTVPVPVQRLSELSTYGALLERVHQLWKQGLNDRQMSEVLTAEGFRSAQNEYVTINVVLQLRKRNRWLSQRDCQRLE
jgi:DNA invertase Pin-like site-specific DNA recombinase